MSEPGVAFADLSPEHFPFTVEFIDEASGEVLEKIEVAGPGAIEVPSYKPRKITVRTTWPGGLVNTTTSAGVSTIEE